MLKVTVEIERLPDGVVRAVIRDMDGHAILITENHRKDQAIRNVANELSERFNEQT